MSFAYIVQLSKILNMYTK